ncbi:MAG: Holliday junction branch migration protein RuvA, partial [Streptococcus cristatus]|nr:Holliday junction branch migration protein RuvA [Streptococcus cristatus]
MQFPNRKYDILDRQNDTKRRKIMYEYFKGI